MHSSLSTGTPLWQWNSSPLTKLFFHYSSYNWGISHGSWSIFNHTNWDSFILNASATLFRAPLSEVIDRSPCAPKVKKKRSLNLFQWIKGWNLFLAYCLISEQGADSALLSRWQFMAPSLARVRNLYPDICIEVHQWIFHTENKGPFLCLDFLTYVKNLSAGFYSSCFKQVCFHSVY